MWEGVFSENSVVIINKQKEGDDDVEPSKLPLAYNCCNRPLTI